MYLILSTYLSDFWKLASPSITVLGRNRSIVPQGYEEIKSYSPDLAYLKSEGEFRPFRTDVVHRDNNSANFVNEIVDITRTYAVGRSK